MHCAERYGELKTEIKKLEHQRDQTLRDFESLEKSFADLHQRYLKLKTASQALQQVLTAQQRRRRAEVEFTVPNHPQWFSSKLACCL